MEPATEQQLVNAIKARWQRGERADALRAIADFPVLYEAKSLTVDLAYEEYFQRKEAGEEIDIDAFCNGFSRYRSTLQRRIVTDDFVQANHDLFADLIEGAWPEAGDCICGFRLIEELGRGSIGRVFLAEERALADRQVVVKLTHAASGLGEGETLSKLTHPNVVQIYSIHHEDLSDLTVICMPYLGRATLQDWLDAAFTSGRAPQSFGEPLQALREEVRGPTTLAAPQSYVEGVASLGIALCDALAHTHARGILHLDLKPSNVLITPAGAPLLLDFNLSLTAAARSNLVGGTMPYMAPEQIRAVVFRDTEAEQAIDGRCDVYSLGVVLYQLLTGKYPFAQLDWRRASQEVASALLEQQYAGAPLAVVHDARVGSDISRALAQAMSADRAKRFATAAEFGDALRRAISVPGRWRRYREVHRRAFLAATVAATGSTVLLFAAAAMRKPADERALALGWHAFDEQRDADAEAHFQRAIELDPQNANAWFARGRARQRQKQFALAYEDFSRAHQLRSDGKYSACRAYCSAAKADHLGVIAQGEAAETEGFANARLDILIGKAQRDVKNSPAADERFLQALRRERNSAEALYQRARLAENKDRPAAVRLVAQAVQGDRPTPEMFVAAAMLAFQQQSPGWEQSAHEWIEGGAEHGLTLAQCEKLPIMQAIHSDAALMEKLSAANIDEQPVFISDPLGDAAISRAFTWRNQLPGK